MCRKLLYLPLIVALVFPLTAQDAADARHPLTTTEGVMAQLARRRRDFFLVDVRVSTEFRRRRIPGSINIPVEELTLRLPTRDLRATIVLVDRFGNRAMRAKYVLDSMGFTNVIIFGRIRQWKGPFEP